VEYILALLEPQSIETRRDPYERDVSQERIIDKLTAAFLERIADVIRLAVANKAADRVDALGVLAARVALAFVHVC